MKLIIIRVILLFLIVISPIVLKAQLYGPSFKFSTGYTLLPSGENNSSDYIFLGPGNLYGGVSKYRTLELEYTFYDDTHLYYNGYHYGFTTGIWLENSRNGLLNIYTFEKKYEEITSIGIPLLLANKRFAWQNHARLGVVPSIDINRKTSDEFLWNTRPYHLDLYFSFGFDNIIKQSRTDGWFWTIEIDGRYNILNHTYKDNLDNKVKLLKLGAKIGIYYQFDWYHYRGWDNNY